MALDALMFANVFGEVGELVARSGLFAKIIILLLFVLSVVSWAVMIERSFLLRRASRANREFWNRFGRLRDGTTSMGELADWSRQHGEGPLARIFAYFEGEFWPFYQERREVDDGDRLLLGMLRRGVAREASAALDRQERGLGWLATLSSIAPFLGLLGTVWGIMGSFLQLGRQGAATLDVVGPGIAEALITTVCGLAVAIPAVVGFNYFMRNLQQQEGEMDRLGSVLADVVSEEELARSGTGTATAVRA